MPNKDLQSLQKIGVRSKRKDRRGGDFEKKSTKQLHLVQWKENAANTNRWCHS